MKNIIYTLSDPRNDLVYYVGKSSIGLKRPLQHLSNSHSNKVNEWIKELEKNWFYPKIDIIEEVQDLNNLPEREEHWIQFYSVINPNILNVNCKIDTSSEKFISEEETEIFNTLVTNIGNIHNIFKRQRIARNISQEEISNIMNCSRSTVSLFERGMNVQLSIVNSYSLALKAIEMKRKMINKERSRK